MPQTHQREEYQSEQPTLSAANSPVDPFDYFDQWYKTAEATERHTANIFTLSTAQLVNNQLLPNSRIVLLREYSAAGFVFYSSYQSQKARELESNPQIAANFYWRRQDRQVRIRATVKKLSPELSNRYFKTRPLRSQVGASLSKQSSVLNELSAFKRQVDALFEKMKHQPQLECPSHWGGYVFSPYYYEFWQGRESRLHERLAYTLKKAEWHKQLLYP